MYSVLAKVFVICLTCAPLGLARVVAIRESQEITNELSSGSAVQQAGEAEKTRANSQGHEVPQIQRSSKNGNAHPEPIVPAITENKLPAANRSNPDSHADERLNRTPRAKGIPVGLPEKRQLDQIPDLVSSGKKAAKENPIKTDPNSSAGKQFSDVFLGLGAQKQSAAVDFAKGKLGLN